MRDSHETDRTQVDTSPNSTDRLSTLEEKDTHTSYPRRESTSTQDEDIFPGSSRTRNTDVEKGETSQDGSKQKEEQPKDPNLIEWDGEDDPENPMNWSVTKKWIVTISLGFMTLCVTFASSVFSTATIDVAKLYHVSTVVSTLGTSLFVLGFGFGPLIFGPMSEVVGRKYPLFVGYFLFAVFQIPVAVAQNLETIMICRFLGGVFASAPLGIVGGMLADFWGPVDRGVAVCVFASSVFIGPIAG